MNLDPPSLVEMVSPERPWAPEAACRSLDPDMFFPPSNLPKRERDRLAAPAKRVCWDECPVREECLEFALQYREPHGVWGGFSEDERNKLARQRRNETNQRSLVTREGEGSDGPVGPYPSPRRIGTVRARRTA